MLAANRAAMGLDDQAALGQLVDIIADGHQGSPERLRQLLRFHMLLLVDVVENLLLPFDSEHTIALSR